MDSHEHSLQPEELSAHAAYLRALARGLLGEHSAAEDLVQDTFVAALEHPPRDRGGLRGWLRTVTRNLASNRRRGEGRRRAREEAVARPESLPGAEQALERLELARLLATEVAALREPYRTTVYLRFHEDLGPAAIAAQLGVPVKTVQTRLTRALVELRRRLDERFVDRQAWSVGLLALAYPRGAELGTAATTTLAGVLAVKKFVLVAAVVVVLVLVVQGVRVLGITSSEAVVGLSGEHAQVGMPRPAPDPASVPSAITPRTPIELSIEAAPPTTGDLLLTLAWADDGSPVADVCAEVESLDGLRPRPDRLHVRTDAQGRARFEDLGAGRVRVFPPIGNSEVLTIVAGTTVEAQLTLPTGTLVEGRVVTPDGAAVGGAEIRAERWDGKDRVAHVVARSNPDGSFRARGLDPETSLGAAADGWCPSLAVEPGDLPVGPRGSREVELQLRKPGGRLAGRVVNVEGAPVVAAQVLAGPRGGGGRQLPSGQRAVDPAPALLLTDEEGEFELLGELEPGAQRVEVIAAGHPVWFGSIDVQSGARAWLEVQLERPARVAGRVLDAKGVPRAGAQVRASREVGALRYMDRTPVPTALTDERGEFVLDWVQPGQIEVHASLPKDECAGRARARLVCEPGGTHEVELTLDPEPSIRGRVVDAEGRPLAGWRVYSNSAQWLEMSSLHPGAMSSLGGMRSTDAQGCFVVPNADDLLWNLAVAAPDEFPFPPRAERKSVRASAGEVELVVVNTTLEPCRLVVRLVDVDGRAPQDVEATLWDEHRKAGVFPDYDAASGVAAWTMSPPGRYAVHVRRGVRDVHNGELVELRPGETIDLGVIRLGETGAVEVRVSGPAERELELVEVRLVPAGGGQELTLERDGQVHRAASIAAGRYVLRAGHEALFAPQRELEVRPGEITELELELEPAFPVEITLEFPAANPDWHSLDWEVEDLAGRRLTGGNVRKLKEFPGSAAPSIHGLCLPPGRYTVLATTTGGLRAELALDINDALAARGPHVLKFHP